VNYYSGYGVTPGNIQLGVQAPGSQLTPEQLAELQRIRGLGGQRNFTENINVGGPQPPSMQQQVREGYQKSKQVVKEGFQRGQEGAQRFLGKYGGYVPVAVGAAAAIPGVTTALSEINAGRPTGALGALAPIGLSALGAGLASVKHPLAMAAGYGLMGLGAILPGASASGAESARQKLTGEPTKGKEGEFSTQMAINKQLAELGTTQYRDNMGVYTSVMRDLSRDASNQAYLDLQRNIPLLNQMKNADLTRQQALLNTQSQAYMQQGVVATAGALAQGQQAGTFNLAQSYLQNNPYANSVMQAPQIRFG
jgi:hypothetical protein